MFSVLGYLPTFCRDFGWFECVGLRETCGVDRFGDFGFSSDLWVWDDFGVCVLR